MGVEIDYSSYKNSAATISKIAYKNKNKKISPLVGLSNEESKENIAEIGNNKVFPIRSKSEGHISLYCNGTLNSENLRKSNIHSFKERPERDSVAKHGLGVLFEELPEDRLDGLLANSKYSNRDHADKKNKEDLLTIDSNMKENKEDAAYIRSKERNETENPTKEPEYGSLEGKSEAASGSAPVILRASRFKEDGLSKNTSKDQVLANSLGRLSSHISQFDFEAITSDQDDLIYN
jgi:hypothetical protein